MRVILQVASGPSRGRQIPLQIGEIARFGRSIAADVSFTEDLEMAEVHFEIECKSERCLIRDLSSGSGTLVNEEAIKESSLRHGDKVEAGATQFAATVLGAQADDASESAEDDAAESTEQDATPTLAEICELLELEDESRELVQPEHTPTTFVGVLAENNQFMDAVRLLAFHLPKRESVWWAYHSLKAHGGNSLAAEEEAAMSAAYEWVKDPTEDNRRAAMAAAEAGEFKNAACWLAMSAFWSGPSIAPANLPDVPPDPQLTCQGVSAALLMTATKGDVNQSQQKYQQILKAGQEILDGALPLPN